MDTLSLDEIFIGTTQVIKCAKAKVHVCSDSVLCVGKMYEHTEANAINGKINSKTCPVERLQRIFGIDEELIEFEWNVGPGQRLRSFKRSKRFGMIDKKS